ncbi:MAG: hypothetical protein FD161_4242 [Limisphaerales bacterium]|nr:MAG: hypothetical protein FD161_4242 [Limisphaerales bacterium]KAG0507069.1 MAG: hypothetical protein E1N63_3775 [Limisphaerales bacterium]TXT51730.1 MAG: hypothetical protein FD140_1371 [Limisphaerales bacterium]
MIIGIPLVHSAEPTAAGLEFYERKVRPLFAESCYECHGPDKQKGKLRLDSPAFIRAGGEAGPIFVAGNPAESRLIKGVSYQDPEFKMPPKKKLTARQISDLSEWVKLGAPMPAGEAPIAAAARKEFQITAKDRAHWAFQPVKRPTVPAIANRQSQIANPIDAFLRAKLAAKGLAPNAPASPRELVRRAYYDLTGLPPTPEEVEAFERECSPAHSPTFTPARAAAGEQAGRRESENAAFARLVDRLLDSPRYGEKWGRHWLDLVRFAESNSYELDSDKPNAWRFRDYVIRAFNSDKPYDRFLREQLAGDEFPAPDADALIATGFYRLGIWDNDPADRVLARFDGLDDIVATTSQVFLGLTVDCARCHHHKIDPIPQPDYYRLLAFFQNVSDYRNGGPTDEVPLFTKLADKEAHAAQLRELTRRRGELQTQIAEWETLFQQRLTQDAANASGTKTPPPKPAKSARADLNQLLKSDGRRVLGEVQFAEYQALKRELEQLKPEKLAGDKALAVSERGAVSPPTHLLVRGNPALAGEVVEPGFLEVLNPPKPVLPKPAADARTSGRRTVLANWIASPDNQLTARVMVNRIWQHHFGRGLVRSTSNFGLQGDRPTHPELLDWLASEFVARGWSLKAMHRLIMNSQAYRVSSRGNPAALAADPMNDLLWRFDPRRLTAEELRDSVLAINGSLNLKMFGPSIFVDIPREVLAGQSRPGAGWGKSPPEEQARRSIYIKVKRSLRPPILESFDVAETDRSAPVRFATVQPTQALGMLNSAFLNEQAAVFAARLHKEAGDDVTKQVRLGLQLVTTRPPTDAEVKRGIGLIATLRAQENATAEVALKYFCLMALNLNELVYVD